MGIVEREDGKLGGFLSGNQKNPNNFKKKCFN